MNLLADDVGIASVVALPKTVAENNKKRSGVLAFVAGREQSSDGGLYAEHCEKVRRNDIEPVQRVTVTFDQNQAAAADCGDIAQIVRLTFEIEIFGVREISLRLLLGHRKKPNDIRRIGNRQRTEPQSIDKAEDCGISADAQTERKGCHQREQRLGGQDAECKAKIAKHTLPCSFGRDLRPLVPRYFLANQARKSPSGATSSQ